MKAGPIVFYWRNIAMLHMIRRYNAVAARCLFEFDAKFSDHIELDRSCGVDESGLRFKYRYVPKLRIGWRVLHWSWLAFRRRADVLAVAVPNRYLSLAGCLRSFAVS